MFKNKTTLILRRLSKAEFIQVYGMSQGKLWTKVKNTYDCCYMCNKKRHFESKDYSFFGWDVDHVIPVCCGGDEIGFENLKMICAECHQAKSLIDREIIHIFKRLGLVEGQKYIWTYLVQDVTYIHKLYLFFFNLANYRNKIRTLENKEYDLRRFSL